MKKLTTKFAVLVLILVLSFSTIVPLYATPTLTGELIEYFIAMPVVEYLFAGNVTHNERREGQITIRYPETFAFNIYRDGTTRMEPNAIMFDGRTAAWAVDWSKARGVTRRFPHSDEGYMYISLSLLSFLYGLNYNVQDNTATINFGGRTVQVSMNIPAFGVARPLMSLGTDIFMNANVSTEEEFIEALNRADIETITLTQDLVLTESIRLGTSRWGVAPPPRDLTLMGEYTIYFSHDATWGGFDLNNNMHLIIDGPTITHLPNHNIGSLIRVNAPARLTLISGEIILTTYDIWSTSSQGTTLGGGGSAVSLTGTNLSTGRGYFVMEGGAIYVNSMLSPRTHAIGVRINRLHTFIMNGGVIGIRGTLPDVALFDDVDGPLILDAFGPVERHRTSGVEVTMGITHRVHENETPGEFIMNGGLIAGARIGVNVNSDRDDDYTDGAIFTMHGGKIGGNLIGMNVNSERIAIIGGSISDNTINIMNDNDIRINVTSPALNNSVNVPTGLQAGHDPDWSMLYQDADLTAFVRNLANAEIARAGATTNVERLRAIYDFVSMQFNHTHPQRTSSIRAARDGSRRPSRGSVPYPDRIGFIDSTALGGQGIISGSRRIPRAEDYVFGAWEMLYHLYAAPGNYAALFQFMARSIGFEAVTFSGWFMPDSGDRFEHVWPMVRLDNNWYVFDAQREAFTNNTNSATHNFFMQPVRDTLVQDRYHLCQYCLDFLATFPRVEGATIFTTGGTAQPAADDNIRVLINGTAVVFDVPPIIQSGRTLVPLRAISEALGAEAEWCPQSQGITLTIAGAIIRMTVGSDQVSINGNSITLDTPPILTNGRTLIPLRDISELFGYDVVWDASTRAAIITTQ